MGGTCETCAYANAHGWYGPGHGAHCRVCHASWKSMALAHCTVCHETFSTNGTADLHWRRSTHLDPRGVAALRLADDGIWHAAGARPAHWQAAS
ncbi:MAG: hypothetical protein M0020_05795 [Actinomycetota bacterium]|nr:hypothetical protein [Actinomycetota bacterium]